MESFSETVKEWKSKGILETKNKHYQKWHAIQPFFC